VLRDVTLWPALMQCCVLSHAQAGGIRRNQAPVLMRLREEVVEGKYALVLGFDSKLPFPEWEVRAYAALMRSTRTQAWSYSHR
jgi:hypothetical protein